jgi:hypothetical protein
MAFGLESGKEISGNRTGRNDEFSCTAGFRRHGDSEGSCRKQAATRYPVVMYARTKECSCFTMLIYVLEVEKLGCK